jgi:hypothetical protein
MLDPSQFALAIELNGNHIYAPWSLLILRGQILFTQPDQSSGFVSRYSLLWPEQAWLLFRSDFNENQIVPIFSHQIQFAQRASIVALNQSVATFLQVPCGDIFAMAPDFVSDVGHSGKPHFLFTGS